MTKQTKQVAWIVAGCTAVAAGLWYWLRRSDQAAGEAAPVLSEGIQPSVASPSYSVEPGAAAAEAQAAAEAARRAAQAAWQAPESTPEELWLF